MPATGKAHPLWKPPLERLNLSMKWLTKIGRNTFLLLISTMIFTAAVVGGFYFQPPSIDAQTSSVLTVSCWLHPCKIDDEPTYPWQRHGVAQLTEQVAAFTITTNDNMLLVYDNHDVVFLNEHNEALLEFSLSSESSITTAEVLDDSFLLTGHADGSLTQWDLEGHLVAQISNLAATPISQISITADGLIVTLHNDGRVFIIASFDKTFTQVEELVSTTKTKALAISSQGEVFTGTADGKIIQWATDGTFLKSHVHYFSQTTVPVSSLSVVHSNRMAVGYDNGMIALFDPTDLSRGLTVLSTLVTLPADRPIVALGTTNRENILAVHADGTVHHRLTNGPVGSLGKLLDEWHLQKHTLHVQAVTMRADRTVLVSTSTGYLILPVGVVTSALWTWITFALGVLGLVAFVMIALQTVRKTEAKPSLEPDRITEPSPSSPTMTELLARSIASLLAYNRAAAPQTFCIDGPWGSENLL